MNNIENINFDKKKDYPKVHFRNIKTGDVLSFSTIGIEKNEANHLLNNGFIRIF